MRGNATSIHSASTRVSGLLKMVKHSFSLHVVLEYMRFYAKRCYIILPRIRLRNVMNVTTEAYNHVLGGPKDIPTARGPCLLCPECSGRLIQ